MEKESHKSSFLSPEEAKIEATSERRRSSGVDVDPSDIESRRGSGNTATEKSSRSTPQASDYSSGIEMKFDTTPSNIPQLKIDPGSQSEAEAFAPVVIDASGKSPGKSPHQQDKSPSSKKSQLGAKIKEGIRRMRKSLSPKRYEDEDSDGGPNKDLEESKRSPDRSPKRSSRFRSKSRSPGKADKRRSREEIEPILLGDELRRSSTSSEDQQKAAAGDGCKGGAISKVGHQQKRPRSKEKSPKAVAHESMDTSEDKFSSNVGKEKSPKRSSRFRSKSRSPGKADKRRSREENEPILLGDEFRCSSTSSEDQQKAAAGDGSQGRAISKVGHQQKRSRSKEKSPKAVEHETMDVAEDGSSSKVGKKESRKNLKLDLKKGKKKTSDGGDGSTENPYQDEYLTPEEVVEIGKWSSVRITPDEDYTCSPEETDMDLDSPASLKDDTVAERKPEVPTVTEREIGSARELMSETLALKDLDETSKGTATESPRGSKRHMEPEEAAATRELPDPGPSPKKQPKIVGQPETKDNKSGEKRDKSGSDVNIGDKRK